MPGARAAFRLTPSLDPRSDAFLAGPSRQALAVEAACTAGFHLHPGFTGEGPGAHRGQAACPRSPGLRDVAELGQASRCLTPASSCPCSLSEHQAVPPDCTAAGPALGWQMETSLCCRAACSVFSTRQLREGPVQA